VSPSPGKKNLGNNWMSFLASANQPAASKYRKEQQLYVFITLYNLNKMNISYDKVTDEHSIRPVQNWQQLSSRVLF